MSNTQARHRTNEALETLHGLAEMIADGLPRDRRADVHRLVDVQGELLETRLAILEERLAGVWRMIAALGAALGALAGALVVLAD